MKAAPITTIKTIVEKIEDGGADVKLPGRSRSLGASSVSTGCAYRPVPDGRHGPEETSVQEMDAYPLAAKFPCSCQNFPVPRKDFPVRSLREFG